MNGYTPTTDLVVWGPPVTRLLPSGAVKPTADDRIGWDHLRTALAAAQDELGLARARYATFRTWLLDEAENAGADAERVEVAPDDECPPRLRALLDVIERLPEGSL